MCARKGSELTLAAFFFQRDRRANRHPRLPPPSRSTMTADSPCTPVAGDVRTSCGLPHLGTVSQCNEGGRWSYLNRTHGLNLHGDDPPSGFLPTQSLLRWLSRRRTISLSRLHALTLLTDFVPFA